MPRARSGVFSEHRPLPVLSAHASPLSTFDSYYLGLYNDSRISCFTSATRTLEFISIFFFRFGVYDGTIYQQIFALQSPLAQPGRRSGCWVGEHGKGHCLSTLGRGLVLRLILFNLRHGIFYTGGIEAAWGLLPPQSTRTRPAFAERWLGWGNGGTDFILT